jgi:hypothetical protein
VTQRLFAETPQSDAWFGYTVKLSNGVAVVGAYNSNNSGAANSGAAYVYTQDRATGQFNFTQRLTPRDPYVGGSFSLYMAFDGHTLAISASNELTNGTSGATGAIYLYTRDAGSGLWELQTKIDNAASNCQAFGRAVGLHTDLLVAGCGQQSCKGTRVYKRVAGAWPATPTAILGPEIDARSLEVQSTGGTSTIIAASMNNNLAYVYTSVQGRPWELDATLDPAVPGSTVTISGFGMKMAYADRVLSISAPFSGVSTFGRAGASFSWRRAPKGTWGGVVEHLPPAPCASCLWGYTMAVDRGCQSLLLAGPYDTVAGLYGVGTVELYPYPSL